nr:hypothetical protein [Cyanothece sp. BG0011]
MKAELTTIIEAAEEGDIGRFVLKFLVPMVKAKLLKKPKKA